MPERREFLRTPGGWAAATPAFPHAVPSSDRLKAGDALILSFGAQVGGYNVECERSFCVGKPGHYARRLLDAMLASRDTGVGELKLGRIGAKS